LLTSIILTAGTFAPAVAGPSSEPLLSVETASLPKIVTPDLLDPQAEPELAVPNAEDTSGDDAGEDAETSTVRPTGDLSSMVAQDAETSTVRPTGDLSSMVAQLKSSDAGSRELECLATGIYFEAKSEPLAGQLAVGQVIANRAQSGGRFPSSYCGVLFQRGQFSFVHGRSLPSAPRASRQWQTAVAMAKIVDQDLKESAVGNALFFHARYVSPGWHLKRVASIGNHVFYR